MQDTDVDSILKHTGTEEDLDGNIKYEGKIRGFVLKYNCGLCVAYMAMAFVLQILIFFRIDSVDKSERIFTKLLTHDVYSRQ